MSTPPVEPAVPVEPVFPKEAVFPEQPLPPEEPVVPPWGRPTPPTEHAYATPNWPQPPVVSQADWGTPEAHALHEAEAALRKARTALGWAVGAAVGALIALLAAFLVPLVTATSTFSDAGYPYSGQIESFAPGRALTGSSVASAVEDVLVDDGADVSSIDCPDTATAQVSTVIACQGSVDDEDWTYVVYVLDDEGSILVTEY